MTCRNNSRRSMNILNPKWNPITEGHCVTSNGMRIPWHLTETNASQDDNHPTEQAPRRHPSMPRNTGRRRGRTHTTTHTQSMNSQNCCNQPWRVWEKWRRPEFPKDLSYMTHKSHSDIERTEVEILVINKITVIGAWSKLNKSQRLHGEAFDKLKSVSKEH